MFQKEKRKGCCTYSWPVSVPCLWTSWCQSLGVGLFGFFLGSFFLLFVFSLSFFSGFLNPKRAISPALSVWTPSHMRTARHLPAASARKSLGRFITLIYEPDLVEMRESCTSPFVSRFQNDHRESGARCKKCPTLLEPQVLSRCFLRKLCN